MSKCTKEVCDQLSYIFFRWQDENQYEDIKEYKDFIKKLFPDASISKITLNTKLLRVEYEVQGKKYKVEVKATAKGCKLVEYVPVGE